MKVFVCWSGERSKAIAVTLKQWLPEVVAGLKCAMSDDIPKGTEWFTSLKRALRGCQAGILCFTPENFNAPWLHLEAGAIMNQLKDSKARKDADASDTSWPPRSTGPEPKGQMAALFTYLFELSELPGPLSAFQATRFDKGETKQLVVALAKQLGDSAPSIQAIEANFEKTWGWFKAKLEAIQPLPIQKSVPGFERLFSVKTFAEPFPDCLDERWRERYQGIVETLTALRERDTEQLALHPYHSRLYHELIGQLERYATIVGGALLEEKKYRDIPEEHQERCEKTRSDVLKLTRLMLRSYNPPVFEESLQFRVFDAADDRNDLIHQMEIRLDKIPLEKIERAKESLTWALDRIVFYLACAKKRARDIEPKYLAACVRREVEQARARGLIDRLQPLDHSVEALAENLPEGSERAKLTPLILTTLDQVERFLEGDARRDPGNDIRSWIATIRAQLEPATSRDGKLQAKVRDASRGLFPETSS